MKAGLTSSAILHAIVIGWGLFSFSSPKSFDVSDAEALPVDIVPIESITQVQQGDKKAAMKEKPAPKPTSKPQTVENAENAGDNELDLKTPPKPDAKPKPVETAEAAKPEPKPVEKPEPLPDPKPEPKPEPAKVPATEVQPQPQPKQEVKPDPVAEAIEKQTESPDAEAIKLPDKVPAPDAKPKPPQAQTAKTPDRKPTEQTERAASAAKTSSQEKDAIADEVRALLNREKAAGGGAKRSSEQASLGGERNTGGSKLSQSEMDALRGQIARCWNVPAGAADAKGLRVTVKMRLTEAGEIEGAPEVVSGGGDSGIGRVAAESARRAVIRCAPYNLPRDKYDAWADVIVNFDPSEMF
ncbi:cell envelope integrity protein TolA [Phyllobacterium phragmitis]|uniref:Protein TolA n=1 Tax=Phyllobacterium phragmitis TaxID=2670329 RepID=A0ABQ0H2S0_9HYPH